MGTPDTDTLVQVFVRIRAARKTLKAKYTDEDAMLNGKLKMVEVELLRRAQDQRVEGFKTKYGTTYISEDVHASVGDNDAFVEFLETQENPYVFFENRPSLKTIKEYQRDHDGASPPGIRLFRENRMRVLAKKGEDDNE
mgnify:CR=1 FL=1